MPKLSDEKLQKNITRTEEGLKKAGKANIAEKRTARKAAKRATRKLRRTLATRKRHEERLAKKSSSAGEAAPAAG